MKGAVIFSLIFIIGELLVNFSVFKYLKKYFHEHKSNRKNAATKSFLGLELSIFKGILERFTVYFFLVLGVPQVLILYGALKIGTRIDKSNEISNDYFLVGNFTSILISAIYYYLHGMANNLLGIT